MLTALSRCSPDQTITMTLRATTLLLLALVAGVAMGYSATPELNKRAMAGVWRLTGKLSVRTTDPNAPMKEFTTYPKKPIAPPQEYLLMLKEDGSFQQYDEDEQKKKKQANLISRDMRGTWDYRDGELILAADRDDDETKQEQDTMLVGRVVAKSQESLSENPVLEEEEEDKIATSQQDTHLSVPEGDVKVGRFMYPKKHKMFFEQTMFKPLSMGSFKLKQVLGTLNAAVEKEEKELIERFRKSDFADKKFLMTNYPIPERKPKGDLRWSIKYNKFVEDPIKKTPKQQEAEDANKSHPIRVMEVKLFANNTFMTTAGLGDSTVLRGKWWIIGEERDQLWMQVWRFGFGRSVSGSTFSEGKSLTHDDAKTYWGWINYVDEDESNEISAPKQKSQSKPAEEGDEPRRLQVKGSVILGYGLEPQPVARFIMREELNDDDFDDDEEEEDDDEDGIELKFSESPSDDGIDWSTSFQ